jgi:hypothetical protein
MTRVEQLSRLAVVFGRTLWHLARWLPRAVRQLWWRLDNRARLAASLAVLVMLAADTATVMPALSALAQGGAVVLIAAVGLSMILRSPFRR